MTQVLAFYSETGGANKTTSSVSVATEAARSGLNVVLIDTDPRGASTKWIGVDPIEPGLHVGAILGNEDPTGWLDELAVPTPWSEKNPVWAKNLRFIPSSREVSLREKDASDHAELRLKMAITGTSADVVIIDCPNRQGGPLILNALAAADDMIYVGKLDEDGLDGIDGAVETVKKFKKARSLLGVPDTLREPGIIIGQFPDTVMPRDARRALTVLEETYPGRILAPFVPHRVAVKEARTAGVYYGDYAGGRPVAAAYRAIAETLIPAMPKTTTETTK